jgi:hypothetical protein
VLTAFEWTLIIAAATALKVLAVRVVVKMGGTLRFPHLDAISEER